MLPMKPLRLQLGTSLAADAATLAPAANANKVALIKAPFTPAETLVPADLSRADFDGSTPLDAGLGTQKVGLDPATGEQRITIKEPAGSWYWKTSGVTNLPQTIYGFALYDNTFATLLAVALLPTPVALLAVDQEIDLGALTLTFVAQPMN